MSTQEEEKHRISATVTTQSFYIQPKVSTKFSTNSTAKIPRKQEVMLSSAYFAPVTEVFLLSPIDGDRVIPHRCRK
jgi:hypothetical protein